MASYDEAIPPGQVGKVKVELKTDKYRGPVQKSIQVTTNDPQQPSIKLVLKAEIIVSAEVLPAAMLVLPHPKTWDPSGRLVVRKDPAEPGELKISDIKSPVPWLRGTARKVATAEPAVAKMPEALPGDWILELKLADDAPVARSRHEVTFATGLSREPVMTVTVGVEFSAALLANPPQLVLRLPPGGQASASGVIEVKLRPDLAGRQLEASMEPGPFTVALERASDRSYRATVVWKEIAGEPPPLGQAANVSFVAGSETLTVPVFLRQRPNAAATQSGSSP